MYRLIEVIPDAELLLALEPEELAGKLILLMQRRLQEEFDQLFHLGNAQNES